MEAEAGQGGKKLKGCGLLSLICGRHRRTPSKKSIPRSRPPPPPTPAKPLLSSSRKPQRSSQAYSSQLVMRRPAPAQAKNQVLTPENGLSGELDRMIVEKQKAKGSDRLVRASSGNVMLYGQLGNIWGAKPKPYQEAAVPGLCRALSKRTDPEKLKEMGNEEFRAGRLGEALALYNRAANIDPMKASYRSNKAAALAGMGRLVEAVGECREAVRIDPSYSRAHHRLGTLYIRLGEVERAVHHYKLSAKGDGVNDNVSKALNLQMHIVRCGEARKVKDWKNLLKECQFAISSGADSAPKVFASQAEALLRLGRHEEADSVLKNAPNFGTDAIRSLFGPAAIGYILMIQAEVDLASGRFDEAVTVAEMAVKDQNDRETNEFVRRARTIAIARNKGNELFKDSKYREACVAYGEGLDHDPLNAVLLCNRAACLAKLQQWEKAIEECSTVLHLRPSYAKARLRRADCYAQLGKWEASVQDYEMLMREFPGDKEVSISLLKARSQLQKR